MTESEYKDALSWILARYDLELSGQEESKMREMLVKVNVYENNIIIPEPTSEGIADFLKDQNANCQL